MGQKTNPIGFRLAVRRNWQSRWFASKKDFPEAPARGPADPHQADGEAQAGLRAAHLHRARLQPRPGQDLHRPPRHRHRPQGPGGREHQGAARQAHRQGDPPRHPGGQEARDRGPAGRRERRPPARAPHRLPPRHEEGRRDGHGARRRGHQDPVLRPPGRRRHRPPRMAAQGPRAAPHPAREHRLRLCRGAHRLRQDRRQVLDLQKGGRRRPN